MGRLGSAGRPGCGQSFALPNTLKGLIVVDGAETEHVPRTALICHADDALNREGLARWLAATTNLVGVVILDEPARRIRKRIQREIQRVGPLRFADVLAFRWYYKLFLAGQDRQWEQQTLAGLRERFPAVTSGIRTIEAKSPNTAQVEQFLKDVQPDIVIARCKSLLKESVFSIATRGTFVMHPGICPQYRNAHGCFWALAKNDRDNVGMTLLKIDKGIDTGPVYGYYRCNFDETRESHHVIQHKVVFDNLDSLEAKLKEIYSGQAQTIDTHGLPSGEWGQPWLTAYRSYIRRAKQRSV
jgi:folate-dependent phosphoribosylglycinamide formyltransferase PurN